jgi:GT2 family glycosyltransferase
VLGFVACGAIVRRSAFLEVDGFHPRYGVGGEEALLALDLAAAGWGCAYVPDITAHHHPSPRRDPDRRRSVMVRNDLWTTMLRRPLPVLFDEIDRLVDAAAHDRAVAVGLAEAIDGAADLWGGRRVLPPWLEQQLAAGAG